MKFDLIEAAERALHVGHTTPPAAAAAITQAKSAITSEVAHITPAVPVVQQGLEDVLNQGLHAAGLTQGQTDVADRTTEILLQLFEHFIAGKRAQITPAAAEPEPAA